MDVTGIGLWSGAKEQQLSLDKARTLKFSIVPTTLSCLTPGLIDHHSLSIEPTLTQLPDFVLSALSANHV